MWRCVNPPRLLLRRKQGVRGLAWAWQAPAVRRRAPPRWCTCSAPIFVRLAANAYRCDVCGGAQQLQGGGNDGEGKNVCRPSLTTTAPAPHGHVTVMLDLKPTEAARRVGEEVRAQVAAAHTDHSALAARLAVARSSSRCGLDLYAGWCAQASAPTAFGKRRGDIESEKTVVTVDALHDAMYALRFATATYALPYELGYFDSIWRNMQLRLPRHQRYVAAAVAEQAAAMQRILLGARHDPLLEVAHARCSVCLGQASFAIFLDHRRQRVVVAFRGTLTAADAIADLASGYARVRLGAAVPSLPSSAPAMELYTHVPRGFYTNVMEVGPQVMEALTSIRQQWPDYEVMCVGHSLGAVEAILFHLLFCLGTERGAAMRTIAIAPAPCIDSAAAVEVNGLLGDGAMTSWVYGLDAVPRLQVSSILDLFYPPARPSTMGSSGSASVQQQQQQPGEGLPLLSIPGRLLHVPADGTDVLDVPVDAPWWRCLFVGKDAVLHHFPAAYAAAFHNVLLQRAKQRKKCVNEEKKETCRKDV
ncbi:hypothetical protein DQ04_05121030 [Trypanosoma grayi]|uniref:hypothetical protein n=1 Tax=Trypanosoma grayi TaxID=71804 RepID=UPI0004F49853|nr:hypothetical protein DQ04_05121030 [Trypanosoma grayi]KEG09495.1 hypothetical protein DQ04_05121030 [Trypanosoma grayi]